MDDERILVRMEKAASKPEKHTFTCKNCGSNRYEEQAAFIKCKACNFTIRGKILQNKETMSSDCYVVEGPKTICNKYGAKGFTIPQGQFALARLGYSNTGEVDMIAHFHFYFHSREDAERLCQAIAAKEEVRAIELLEVIPLAEEYEPKNIVPIKNKEDVFDFGVTDLSKDKPSIFDKPHIIMFSCGDCGSHKSINTAYNKDFKIKEPCGRCGKLIKAELVI